MAGLIPYDRERAVAYARRWALGRNPDYADFHGLGGDCTNFVSQSLYAGGGVMNFERDTGWYYINIHRRSPAWSGVKFLHRFLMQNEGAGPIAESTDIASLEMGDIIFLGNGTRLYHSLFVVKPDPVDPLIAAHTLDAWERPLTSYAYEQAYPVHILGFRPERRRRP